MPSKITLAPGVVLPLAEVATEVTAAIGIRGSGKSNVLAVLAEAMLMDGIQVVVLDPVGLWFSLRLMADGVRPSPLKIHVLGGRHGDIPLIPSSGRTVATALATTRASAVLDVSQMSKADRCRFAADFSEQLLRDKKDHQGPTWLLLEEAQFWAPQVIRHGLEFMGRMLGAFEEMAEVGRNFGLGLGLATQRPQKVNKEVLNLSENVLAFRLLGALERRAMRDWISEQDAPGREAVDETLPNMPQGEAIIWSPVRGIYRQAKVPKKGTYDAGATPLAAREKVKVGALDLGALAAAMQSMVEEAARNDVGRLRARIAELEGKLREAMEHVHVQAPPQVVEICPAGAVAALRRARVMLESAAQETDENLQELRRRAGEVLESEKTWERARNESLQGGSAAPMPRPPSPGGKARPGANGAASGPSPLSRAIDRAVAEADRPVLSPAARAMLEAFGATRLPGLTWKQAATLARRKARGGAFDRDKRALLGHLPQQGVGLVEAIGFSGPGEETRFRITDKGRALVPAPVYRTADDLMVLWSDKLPAKAVEMLRYIRRWGAEQPPLNWDAVASGVGLKSKNNGNFQRYQTLLRSNGLVVEPAPGAVVVAEELR